MGSVLFECLLALSLFQFTVLLTWTSLGVLHRQLAQLETRALAQQQVINTLNQWVNSHAACPGKGDDELCEVCLTTSKTDQDPLCLRAQSKAHRAIPSWS